MMNWIYFFILLCLQVAYIPRWTHSSTITVTLDSKWTNTPIIAEASEYFSSESVSIFWKFVNLASSLVGDLPVGDEEAEYRLVVGLAKRLLPGGDTDVDVMKLHLVSRSFSPVVEMNMQLAQSERRIAGQNEDLCPEDTVVWAVLPGKPSVYACTVDQLQMTVKSSVATGLAGSLDNSSYDTSIIYRTDKVFSPASSGLGDIPADKRQIVILYGDLRSPDLYKFHDILKVAAEKGRITYVFRHYIKIQGARKTRLPGYGVELTIKSTEYKAVDDTKVEDSVPGSDDKSSSAEDDEIQGFVFSQLRANHPNLTQELNDFKKHLVESDSEIRPLKAWQFQDLSVQAAYEVARAQESGRGLEMLRDLSQNYPVRAGVLSEVKVPSEFRREMLSNQRILESEYNIHPGKFFLSINGFVVRDLDIFGILELVRRETKVMSALYNLGIRDNDITTLSTTSLSPTDGTVYALDMRSSPVTFVNNLESDTRYHGWPQSLQELLMPAYPGMLRRVAKNMFNLIAVVDPASQECLDTIRYAEAFVVHSAPIRMGLLWAIDPSSDINTSPGRALVRVFNFVRSDKEDPLKALSFLTDIYSKINDLTVESIKTYFHSRFKDVDLETVFGSESDYDENVHSGWEYLKSRGISVHRLPLIFLNGIPLSPKSILDDGFESTVVGAIMEQTAELQKAVYQGQINDAKKPLDFFMERPNVVERLNARLLDKEEKPRMLQFGVKLPIEPKSDIDIASLSDEELITHFADKMVYFMKSDDKSAVRSVSVWLVTDLTTERGQNLTYEALKTLKSSTPLRLGVIHNPSNMEVALTSPDYLHLTNLLQVAATKLAALNARNLVTKALKQENIVAKKTIEDFSVGGMDVEKFLKDMKAQSTDYLILHQTFIRRVLKVQPGEDLIIANGRVYGPLMPNETFISEDFKLLERLTVDSSAGKVASRLADLTLMSSSQTSPMDLSDLTMRVSAILTSAAAAEGSASGVGYAGDAMPGSIGKRVELKSLEKSGSAGSVLRIDGSLSSAEIAGSGGRPALEVVMVVDPLTREAQKASHLVIVLSQAVNCNIRIVFNSKEKHSDAPMKSFYRFVWDSSMILSDGSMSSPRALFSRLPSQPLLTMGIDAPHSWLVEAVRTVHDLDNIRMSDTGSQSVIAGYELSHLLLEGHCLDVSTGQPPRGLQFTLGTRTQPEIYDTIVMANLGYFQMKANPGAWYLNLREGKSKDIYTIHGHENTDSTPGSPDVVAVLDNFRPKIVRVRVAKRPDKMDENVLGDKEDMNDADSLWSSISSAFKPGTESQVVGPDNTLNIFSLASGHLYERFLRLMMLSVTKHTKSKVKFWFLKNYLSPSFKDFIPHMAKEYGFQYQLVEYKWPRWLHQQTEKQRIIWGYKILFLDVLFPLSVKKIIFVDADQIVRADLQELANLDLEGAPYGYTPFCSSRPEMHGFQFWSSGYWAQHLAGRPYHISALYVVDLVRFRKMAAGDRLRGQYHGLSQDPNSLSNLDQDLPNNMIHQVPIKSLPQEWLWCETWCSDTEKSRAKTIDLCNNPQTKEPKLAAAMRIIPEWRDYDQEVKRLWDKVYGTHTAAQSTQTSKDLPIPEKTEF